MSTCTTLFLTDSAIYLVLLKHLAADVKGKVIRVHNSADEGQVAGQQLVELVGDEHLANVQLQPAAGVVCVASESTFGK